MRIPYPLRATRLTIDIMPFDFWLWPRARWNRDLTEFAKEQGATIAYARWAWFQVSVARFL